jgi:hypothetical protein
MRDLFDDLFDDMEEAIAEQVSQPEPYSLTLTRFLDYLTLTPT